MNRPTLFLMVGYPGAGKTTVAQMISRLTGAVHVWADKLRSERFGSTYRSEDSPELYDALNNQAESLLKGGKSVIFDTNFNYYEDRQKLRQIAQAAGASTKLIWLTTPQDVAYDRAITQTNGKRLFIDMTHADFERIAGHLQPPRDTEQPIKLDGTHVTEAELKKALDL